MSIGRIIYQSIKRKHSPEKEANRLKMPLNVYLDLKHKALKEIQNISEDVDSVIIEHLSNLFDKKEYSKSTIKDLQKSLETKKLVKEGRTTEVSENLEKGTSKITGLANFEPRSPQEIIDVLKIDTTKWKLSQYWNKEQSNGVWLISAMVTKITEDELLSNSFLEVLSTIKLPKYPVIKSTKISSEKTPVCGVMSLQDLHFGKPGNENLPEIVKNAVLDLCEKSSGFYMEELILILGSDTLNMDTFNGTTTKGTPVENSELATKTYVKAFNSLSEIIHLMKDYCKTLKVIYIPGNHDRLSSFHLLHALSQIFTDNKDIIFDTDYAERKVLTYGKNMLCFEHGDTIAKNNPLIFATEYAKEWGMSTYRKLYTGHLHYKKHKEFLVENQESGFTTKILPALTSSDYYHYHNKWIGNQRSAVLELNHKDKGIVAEFTYVV